jgi:hypothetical protein
MALNLDYNVIDNTKSFGSCPFRLGCMLLFNLRSLALGYNLSLASLNEWLYLLILIVILIAGSSFSALFFLVIVI